MSLSKIDFIKNQEKLDNDFIKHPIRFDKAHIIKTLADIIFCLIMYNTYYINLDDTVKIHCQSGKRRSFLDLYLLCKYYKINITLKECDYIMYELSCNYYNDDLILHRLYCYETKRYTHVFNNFTMSKPILNEILNKLNLNKKI
jgi:hypothetical protein